MKELKPHGGQLFNPNRQRHGETEKRPAVALYLDELLSKKCKFGGHFNVSNFYLERYFPKDSCHLNESKMNHTLTQKHLIELLIWNTSYVQKNPIKPNRSNWMTRNEKLCEGNLSMSSLEESNYSDAARLFSIDIGNSDGETRVKREIENQVVLK